MQRHASRSWVVVNYNGPKMVATAFSASTRSVVAPSAPPRLLPASTTPLEKHSRSILGACGARHAGVGCNGICYTLPNIMEVGTYPRYVVQDPFRSNYPSVPRVERPKFIRAKFNFCSLRPDAMALRQIWPTSVHMQPRSAIWLSANRVVWQQLHRSKFGRARPNLAELVDLGRL